MIICCREGYGEEMEKTHRAMRHGHQAMDHRGTRLRIRFLIIRRLVSMCFCCCFKMGMVGCWSFGFFVSYRGLVMWNLGFVLRGFVHTLVILKCTWGFSLLLVGLEEGK